MDKKTCKSCGRDFGSEMCRSCDIEKRSFWTIKDGIKYSMQKQNKQEIKRNAIKCLSCGAVIVSKHVHDFVTCPCGKVSVDGGPEYLKRSFPHDMKAEDAYEEMSNQPFPLPDSLKNDII